MLGVILLLYIPSLIIGWLTYVLLLLYSVPQLSVIIKLVPFIGENTGNFIQLIFGFITDISRPTFLSPTLALVVSAVIASAMLLLFGLMNTVETAVNHQYRDSRIALRNGFIKTIDNLNIPRKIASTVYQTWLCLFTDQKTVSLNIPVINTKNVEIAMQKALSINSECYIIKLPLDPKKLLEILEKMPSEFLKEIENEFKKVSERNKNIVTIMGRNMSPKANPLVDMNIVYGLNIDPNKREEILRLAESFICEKFAEKFSLDGTELSEMNSAIAQSLLELFVRNKAAENMPGAMLRIDLSTYEGALDAFKEFVSQKFDSYDLLKAFWLEQAKVCVCNTFSKSGKVFKNYLIGDLCESLYIDNKTAEAVIEELKSRQFIANYGKQHGQDLLIKKSNA